MSATGIKQGGLSASFTQTSAIPLTTVLTPDDECTAASAYESTEWASAQRAYQLDGGINKPSCYPESYSEYQHDFGLWYSPGVCPHLYNYVATSVYRPESGPATTLAVCCPPGVHSAPYTGFYCYEVLTTVITNELSFASSSARDDETTTLEGTTAYANPISVAWQESDLSLFTPASAPVLALQSAGITFPPSSAPDSESSSSPATSTAETQTTSSPAVPGPGSGGLSSGAVAGIAVAGAIVLFSGVGGLIWWFRRNFEFSKRRRDASQSPGEKEGAPKHTASTGDPHQHSHGVLVEAPDTGLPAEADYAHTRYELGSGKA